MQHIVKVKSFGHGEMTYLQNHCLCGWIGKKWHYYEDYPTVCCREEREEHFREVKIPTMTIKEFREKKGWTQTQLAEKLCVSDRIVKYWENEGRKPNRRSLRDLKELGYEQD